MFIEVFEEVHKVKLSTLREGDIFSTATGCFYMLLSDDPVVDGIDDGIAEGWLRAVLLFDQRSGEKYAASRSVQSNVDVTPWPKSKLEIK